VSDFGPLVSADWLAAHRDEVRVVDVRWYLDDRSGRAAYEAGHLPGAVWLDVDTDLSAPASVAEGRHPLPLPEAFAAVLDGGLSSWPAELSTDVPALSPVARTARPWPPGRFAHADAVMAPGSAVLDARSAERYAHGDPAIDPRPGHIPGAHSAPWAGNLDPATGRFLAAAALRARFAAIGAGPAIAYCGSGVTACHDLLALEIAGHRNTALYPGSWSQWGADPAHAAETS